MSTSENGSKIFNRELKLRVISALVLGVLVLWMTWVGGLTFVLLWAVLAVAIFHEYTRICRAVLTSGLIASGYAVILLVISSWLTQSQSMSYWIFALAFALFFIWEMAFRRTFWSCLGLAYAILPFFAMSELRDEGHLGFVMIIILFGCVWGADILAFFSGKSFGGPKLAPKISPKKTWSGFIGGLFGAIGLSYLVTKFFGFEYTFILAALILVLAVVSQIGDLLESSLKRFFDVKDSGTIIPGHGGILDRVDGLIVSGVVLWAILKIVLIYSVADLSLASMFERAFLMP